MDFVLGLVFFATIGAIGHVVRGLFNPYPDKMTEDREAFNVAVSPGYTALDALLQVQFDDYGYYRIDSAYNLMVATVTTFLGGAALMVVSPEHFLQVQGMVDWVLTYLAETTSAQWTGIQALFG